MAVPVARSPSGRMAQPSIVIAILGVWLFISAFIWPHTAAQMTNTWIVGVLCMICALVSMAVPWVRYLNTALAVYLFISTWALPDVSPGTIWNNVLVAIAVFVMSLIAPENTSTLPVWRRRSGTATPA
jgi:hypothetical protein